MGGNKSFLFQTMQFVYLFGKKVATSNKVPKLPTQELPPRWHIYRLYISPAERKGPKRSGPKRSDPSVGR